MKNKNEDLEQEVVDILCHSTDMISSCINLLSRAREYGDNGAVIKAAYMIGAAYEILDEYRIELENFD